MISDGIDDIMMGKRLCNRELDTAYVNILCIMSCHGMGWDEICHLHDKLLFHIHNMYMAYLDLLFSHLLMI